MTVALVIDDNRRTADSICQILNLLGLDTQTAYGARAAMRALAEEMPDVVFLDINMPDLSGFEVMAYLKRDPATAELPIIVVSSEDQQETQARVQEMGGTAFVTKPFTVEGIEGVLRENGLV